MSSLSPSPRTYVQLDLDECHQIERMAQRKLPVDEIAQRLGRHRSTVYRELKRNRFTDPEWPDLDGYYSLTADGMAKQPATQVVVAQPMPRWTRSWTSSWQYPAFGYRAAVALDRV